MANPKKAPSAARRPRDETVETLKEIIKSEGVAPKRSLVNKLLLFWVKSSAAAQARGVRIALQVKDHIED